MEFFFLAALVDGGEQHAAGVDAHHGTGRQVGDGDEGLADELFGLVEGVDAAEDGAVGARAVVQSELEELLALGNRLAGKNLHGAEIALGEGLKVHEIRKEGLNHHVGEVDFLLAGRAGFRGRGRVRLLLGGLGGVRVLHGRELHKEKYVAL